MKLSDALIAEMNAEFPNTRKYLAVVPEEHYEFKPHQKSGTMIWLASHVAELPGFVGMILGTEEFDLKSRPVKPAPPENSAELLEKFDAKAADALQKLQGVGDDQMSVTWRLRAGDTVLFELPRFMAIRVMALNHMYHHRGQLGVYLRLNDTPLPGIYGPSADEPRKY